MCLDWRAMWWSSFCGLSNTLNCVSSLIQCVAWCQKFFWWQINGAVRLRITYHTLKTLRTNIFANGRDTKAYRSCSYMCLHSYCQLMNTFGEVCDPAAIGEVCKNKTLKKNLNDCLCQLLTFKPVLNIFLQFVGKKRQLRNLFSIFPAWCQCKPNKPEG